MSAAEARNVEIKVRAPDLAAIEARAAALATAPCFHLVQDDSFFACGNGRLKLRQLSSVQGELIFYRRADTPGARLSSYRIVPTDQPQALRELLAAAYGSRGRIRKQRRVYLVDRTRIHLDRVESLGDFVELEVVLRKPESPADGVRIAEQLLAALGVAAESRLAGAYLDLLTTERPTA